MNQTIIQHETAVIGCLLLPDEVTTLANVRAVGLTPSHFATAHLAEIYRVICESTREGYPVDLPTIEAKIGKATRDALGPTGVCSLVDAAPTAAHAEYHARQVRMAALGRLGAQTCQRYAHTLSETDNPEAELARLSADVTELQSKGQSVAIRHLTEFRSEKVEQWRLAVGRGYVGIPSSLRDLNQYLGGYRPSVMCVLGGYRGQGKCLAFHERVMMADMTFKLAFQVEEGDFVMGPGGVPRRVMEIDRGNDYLFEVHQSKGRSYTVTGNHLLCLRRSSRVKRTHNNRRVGRLPEELIEMTVDEFSKLPRYKQVMLFGYTSGVDLNEQWESSLDPYWFGLWLGDGHKDCTRISTSDACIVEYIRHYADRIGMDVTKTDHSTCPSYGIVYANHRKGGATTNPVKDELARFGVLGNKHIPMSVFRATRKTRLDVMAGIIDTDGYTNGSALEVAFCNKRLAEDLLFLARSLGYHASIQHDKAKCQTGAVSDRQRIYMSGDFGDLPVLMKHKRVPGVTVAMGHDIATKRNKSRLTIIPAGYGPYIGLTVDGDGLFLLDDFTVVHNSTLARQEALGLARAGYKVLICSMEDPGDIAAAGIAGNYAGKSVFHLDTGARDQHGETAIDTVDKEWASLSDLPLWIASGAMKIEDIESAATIHHARHGLDFLVIDHIQFINPYKLPGMDRNGTVATYSQRIVGLLARHKIPALVLSQLSRDSEKEDRKPRLSDLRDSGCIEQDARQVLLLYGDAETETHRLEIAKNNFGVSGKTFELRRLDGMQRFELVREVEKR